MFTFWLKKGITNKALTSINNNYVQCLNPRFEEKT